MNTYKVLENSVVHVANMSEKVFNRVHRMHDSFTTYSAWFKLCIFLHIFHRQCCFRSLFYRNHAWHIEILKFTLSKILSSSAKIFTIVIEKLFRWLYFFYFQDLLVLHISVFDTKKYVTIYFLVIINYTTLWYA